MHRRRKLASLPAKRDNNIRHDAHEFTNCTLKNSRKLETPRYMTQRKTANSEARIGKADNRNIVPKIIRLNRTRRRNRKEAGDS